MWSRKSIATVFLIAVAVLVALSPGVPLLSVSNPIGLVAGAQGITSHPPIPDDGRREAAPSPLLPAERPSGRGEGWGGVRAADAQNVEFIGHIGGPTYAVAVQGNYAYVGEGPSLTILDISNPACDSAASIRSGSGLR